MRPKCWRYAGLLVLALGAAAGCSHAPAPLPECTQPEGLRLLVRAGQRLNPGEDGQSLPTVVRLYQLKAPEKLADAIYDEMLDQDKETLGDTVVGSKELTLNPGEKAEPALERAGGAVYLGVVALFRQPTGNSWRVVQRLPASDPGHCHPDKDGNRKSPPLVQVVVEDNRIEIR